MGLKTLVMSLMKVEICAQCLLLQCKIDIVYGSNFANLSTLKSRRWGKENNNRIWMLRNIIYQSGTV